MIKIPPYLKRGATIGITCPSGYMPMENAKACIQTLQQWGFEVKIGNLLGGYSDNYFSGSDEERLTELQSMMDDSSIDAILFGRGGYGMTRIIDRIHFKKFKKNPKWLIGYSDITVMHMHLLSKHRIASIHAPMAGAFNDLEKGELYLDSLKKVMMGRNQTYTCAAHRFNHNGKTEGILIGGNLSLLINLMGTPSDFETKNKILFIEDIGEYLYNIDRMLQQLKRSGKLEKLSGLIIGGFTDMKDTQRPFGKTIYEIINDNVKDYDYPIAYNFPVSHTSENYALKVGIKYQLNVTASKTTLKVS